MSFEQSTNSKKFTQQVNSLIENGVVGSFAEIADAIGYERSSITNIMKGRRNIPIAVYRKFTEVYKLNEKPLMVNTDEYLIKNAIDARAMSRVTLMALAEILAKLNSQSVAKVLADLTKAVEVEKAMNSIQS